MKLSLPRQPPRLWLCFQCRHSPNPHISKSRGLTTFPRNEESRKSTLPSSLSGLFSSEHFKSALNKRSEQYKEAARPTEEEEKNTILYTLNQVERPHRLHVYAKKHNTHITLSDANRQPLLSVSSGNIGFRKGSRGSYDAAFQLGSYVMGRIKQRGWLSKIECMELILRDFGPGREAIQKILLGTEGTHIRDKVVRLVDATRLKFGGVRSKKPRRLG